MTERPLGLIFSRLATALWLLSPGLVVSQGGLEPGQLDCTIEPRTVAEIGSPEEGIIENVLVKRGDLVEEGQVLAVLESEPQKLTLELAKLQAVQDVEVRSGEARLGFQQIERERAETLSSRDILSDKELDEARVQEVIAQLEVESASIRRQLAQVELALAEERVARRTIRSSISGIVTRVDKVPGEYIHEQTPLLTLARIDELNVEVYVPVENYGAIQVGQKAVVMPVEPIGGRFEATVEVVDRVFDAASGTFGVRLALQNKDSALPAGIRCAIEFASVDSARD